MKLFWVDVKMPPEVNQRKGRTFRYVVMAETESEAAKRAVAEATISGGTPARVLAGEYGDNLVNTGVIVG